MSSWLVALTFVLLAPISVAQTTPTPAVAVYAKAAASVVLIEGRDHPGGSWRVKGTGFVTTVGGRKIIVTAAHVVTQAKLSYVCILWDGTTLSMTRKAVCPSADVAVLSVDDALAGCSSLPLAPGDAPIGETVYVLGFPADHTNLVETTGTICQHYVLGSRPYDGYTAPAWQGDSGGPVINEKGRVVGLVDWAELHPGWAPMAYAVPAFVVARALREMPF